MTEAVEFLSKLNNLISNTDKAAITQAKANLKQRIANAGKHEEPNDMWIHLHQIVESIESVKEFVY